MTNDSWSFRIVALEYDNGDVTYVLETDKGSKDEWSSIFRSPDLEEIRAAKAKREAQFKPVKRTVID
jgi:hypothetical protein